MSETTLQPKTNQKLMVRTAILLFVVAALFFAYQFYLSHKDDWGAFKPAETNGYVSMLDIGKDGSRIALLTPEGKILRDASYAPGSSDREVVWAPDGNSVYFVSDREQDTNSATRAVHIFRWNPTQEKAEARTVGSRSRANPSFVADAGDGASDSLLMVSGGEVLELDPHSQKTTTLLPPRGRETTTSKEEGQGSESKFSAAYSQIGSSFRVARWCKGKQWIAAVMRREEGEILIAQNLEPVDGKITPPVPLAAGAHIDIAVDAKGGNIVYSVRDFQWAGEAPEQFRKNGKTTRPFAHYIGMWNFDLKKQPDYILVSPSEKDCFGPIAPSPDGQTILATAGTYDGDGSMTSKVLISMPLKVQAGAEAKPIANGEIFDPSWHPQGTQILFARRGADGRRSIIRILKDGSGETELATGKGSFGSPLFSPQTK